MIENHTHPPNWGIHPILFRIGNLEVSSYAFFVLLGLIIGLGVYLYLARKFKQTGEKSFYVVMAAVVGGILGAKLPYWILRYQEIIDSFPDIMPILSGRTITGGLIGGTVSVIYIKRKLHIKGKKGNLFAPAIAIGLAIGRIGCLFQGCCYGTETNLFCGIDFGDAVPRHPTQVYEIIFFLVFFVYALMKLKNAPPGHLFYLLMNSYFIFRFLEEFIRYNHRLFFGLSFFQYISVAALAFINLQFYFEKSKKHGQIPTQ